MPSASSDLLDAPAHRLLARSRGSPARRRGRAPRGRRRTATPGPGATKPTTSASSRGCVIGSSGRTPRRRHRTGRRSSAARGRSRRAAACSSPNPTHRPRGAARRAATSRSTSRERGVHTVGIPERHVAVMRRSRSLRDSARAGRRGRARAGGAATSAGSGRGEQARQGAGEPAGCCRRPVEHVAIATGASSTAPAISQSARPSDAVGTAPVACRTRRGGSPPRARSRRQGRERPRRLGLPDQRDERAAEREQRRHPAPTRDPVARLGPARANPRASIDSASVTARSNPSSSTGTIWRRSRPRRTTRPPVRARSASRTSWMAESVAGTNASPTTTTSPTS